MKVIEIEYDDPRSGSRCLWPQVDKGETDAEIIQRFLDERPYHRTVHIEKARVIRRTYSLDAPASIEAPPLPDDYDPNRDAIEPI